MTIDEFEKWKREFLESEDSEFLRLGQAFLNEHYPTISDTALYYEVENSKAIKVIYDRYLQV